MANVNGNGVNGVVKTMFEHPIASFFLIDVTLSGIAGIIRACKGTNNSCNYRGGCREGSCFRS